MARCTREEALETREKLLDAALEVFHAEGVSRPSLSKVAELAGLTRGAVYGHFQNKADLFSALCDRVLLPADVLAESLHQAEQDPLAALRDWSAQVLRETARNPVRRRLFEIIFHKCEMLEETGDVRDRMLRSRREAWAHMETLVRLAIEKGQLPADLDVGSAVPLLHASVTGLLSHWLLKPDDYDLEALADRYAEALIGMLRSPALLRE